MGTKMKGFLKGLRYITSIFDFSGSGEEKEPEMQIGGPTDVKHVAHIGWEGGESSTASKPSWMNGFSAAPELANAASNAPSSKDKNQSEKPKQKSKKGSRRHNSGGNDSEFTGESGSSRHNRRRRSSNNSIDNTSNDSGSLRSTKRNDAESPARDPAIPKGNRARKSKGGSSDSGSLKGVKRSSKSKEKNPSADIVAGESRTSNLKPLV